MDEKPKPLLVSLFESLELSRLTLGFRGIDLSEIDRLLDRARSLVEAIKSGEMVPVEVWVAIDPETGLPVATADKEEAEEYFSGSDHTRATVYARRPKPSVVEEGHAE